MSNLRDRLTTYLEAHGQPTETKVLTADASTREYFRVQWEGEAAVACVYPDDASDAPAIYVDTTRLFLSADLPVAEVLSADVPTGIIIQEDLGDRILRDVMLAADEGPRERLLDEAITLIARIQTATGKALEMNSIASRLKFDLEKLEWELNFFKTHYFGTYLKKPLSPEDDERLSAEFRELATELEGFANVLCHRDFHAANIMLDASDNMRIIDHQDARIGSPAYDLVSLLLDRITRLPSREWLSEKRRYFLGLRLKLGLNRLDEEEFAYEFRLQTVQRCLKAAGTFSFQSANRGKTYFVPFIKPMFGISRRAAESLGRFPAIRAILDEQLKDG